MNVTLALPFIVPFNCYLSPRLYGAVSVTWCQTIASHFDSDKCSACGCFFVSLFHCFLSRLCLRCPLLLRSKASEVLPATLRHSGISLASPMKGVSGCCFQLHTLSQRTLAHYRHARGIKFLLQHHLAVTGSWLSDIGFNSSDTCRPQKAAVAWLKRII